MNKLKLQNITYGEKDEATRSRHSSLAFIPPISFRFTNPTVLKRIVKNRDKGKGI